MTCIVGLVHDGRVWIGGDSAGVDGWDLTVRADAKVFRRGDLAFGFTSSYRMGQLLRYHLDVPVRPDHQDPDEWICTSVVEAIRDCLREGGFAQKKDNVETGGCFLVGGHGHLWRIDRDYQAGRSADPFDAVGCGGAAMSTGRSCRGRRPCVGRRHAGRSAGLCVALAASCGHTTGCGPLAVLAGSCTHMLWSVEAEAATHPCRDVEPGLGGPLLDGELVVGADPDLEPGCTSLVVRPGPSWHVPDCTHFFDSGGGRHR